MTHQEMLGLLKEQLTQDEGLWHLPYRDMRGQLTIGVGHNLESKGLTDCQIEIILSDDIDDAIAALNNYPWYSNIDPRRQMALGNMMFQLGPARFAGFKAMIAALAKFDYEAAADAALDSHWAQETPSRAYRVARQLRTGELR